MLSAISLDLNQDGINDLITAGNFYGVVPHLGQYDAGIGTVLISDKAASLRVIPNQKHGLFLDREIRNMAIFTSGDKKILIAAINNGKPVFYEIKGSKQSDRSNY